MRMRILLTMMLDVLLLFALKAQQPVITRSEAFKDPQYGAGRLLLMHNGNTLYFSFTERKGIAVTVYDSTRRVSAMEHNTVRYWRNWQLDEASLKGLFEMNGQAVLFVEKQVKLDVNLYRLIFDSNSGKLIRQDLVDGMRIPAVVLLPAPESIPRFYVRKDPSSEYYAIAMAKDKKIPADRLIKVTHYTPDHLIIHTAAYTAAESPFGHVQLLDMTVHRDQFVTLASCLYNVSTFSVKGMDVMLSTLKKGTDTFCHYSLGAGNDYTDIHAALKYGSEDNSMYLLTSIRANSLREKAIMQRVGRACEYALQMTIFDPLSLQINRQYFVGHPKLDAYVKEHLAYKNAYSGAIQDFYLHPDRSVYLLFEEIAVTEKEPFSNSDSATSVFEKKKYETRLGEMAIVQLDTAGKEVFSYAIAKSQYVMSKIGMYYQHGRAVSIPTSRYRNTSYNNFTSFYSYTYFPANNAVLFNDHTANTDNSDQCYRNKKDVYAINESNTVLATFKDGEIRKSYLFGAPAGKRESRFSELGIGACSEDGKQYATMMIEQKGFHQDAYIVWVQL